MVLGGVATVFVDGFDFGTTTQALEAHMGMAGSVASVQMKKGSAIVTYSSASEAERAVSELNKSIIEGNSRFIDVQIDKKSLPPRPGVKREFEGGSEGSPKVLVRGFDFGTTDEQLAQHMSAAGSITEVHWVSKGSANVVFSSAAEATAAVKLLNGSTIAGTSRYVDVIFGGDYAAERAAKRFKGGGKGGGGKGKTGGDHSDEDPPGSGRVFVSGFDFGTTDQQLESHMSAAGPIHTVHWVNKGNAVVVYKWQNSAQKAIAALDNSIIPGNSRYINVSPRGELDPWAGKGGASKGASKGAGKAKGAGKSGKAARGDHSDEDPPGGGRVFVRGFDFGTSDEQLEAHMRKAGPVHTIHWVNKGDAVVVYKFQNSVQRAISSLDNSTIPGNSRYINVSPRS